MVLLMDPKAVKLLLPPTSVPFGRSVELKDIVPLAKKVPLARRVPLKALSIPVLFKPVVELMASLAFTATGVMDHGALTNLPNRERGMRVISGIGSLFTRMPR
jgi:hypothetical protein